MTRAARLWLLVAIQVAAAPIVPTALAAPIPPANVRAIPDYGDASIVVSWDDVAGEDGYRIYRAEAAAGPFQLVSPDLPAETTSFIDVGLASTLEYHYRVRAFDGDGESLDSNTFQQNVKTVWPNPGHFALLHNWNDTLGVAGSGGAGYHKGCDIQQGGPTQNTIVFPRGGVVARIGNQGRDNNHIYVEVLIGGTLRYDSFNHLDGNNANALGYDVGDYVRAGQTVGKIADKYFTLGGVDFVDHVHFFVPSDPVTNVVDGNHPLKIFSEVQHRDPQDVRPQIFDHADPGSDTVLYHRQGAPPGAPYLSPPLGDDPGTPEDEGDVDIHVEIADDMNGGAGTTLVPTAVAYWIEGRDCDGYPAVVRDAGSPYTLFRWDDRFFLDQGIDWRYLVDETQDLAPWIESDGIGYPSSWNNFKHFIVTNTSGGDGSPASIDEGQYWNTDAMDDASPATVGHANFAALPDAVRAADARFPDGGYSVNIRMEDLVGESTGQIQDVRLENFPPAVRASCAAGGTPGLARIQFSEPMDQASVESALQLTVDAIGVGFSAAWDPGGCTVTVTPDGSPEQVAWLLDAATATDLAGRSLDGAFDGPSHNGISEGSAVDSVAGTFLQIGLAEVVGLVADEPSDGAIEISWSELPAATGYAITRGLISTLGVGQYGPCLARGVEPLAFFDPELPPTRDGYAYLVQGEAPLCGNTGTLGSTSSAGQRVNGDPDSCY